jgi:hypothetical protein
MMGTHREYGIVELLSDVIASPTRPPEDREKAAKALKFYAERIAAEGDQPTEIKLHIAKIFARDGATMLWETPEDCLFSTKTWEDGVTRTNILSKRFHGPEAFQPKPTPEPEPTPGPAPVVEKNLALPAIVIPPSTAELAAASAYKPRTDDEIAANVAAIVKDAEALKSKLSPVEEVEKSMATRKSTQEQLDAALAELARLKALVAL